MPTGIEVIWKWSEQFEEFLGQLINCGVAEKNTDLSPDIKAVDSSFAFFLNMRCAFIRLETCSACLKDIYLSYYYRQSKIPICYVWNLKLL